MTLGADPALARDVLSELDALRAAVVRAEDEVLACLVVTGEPRPQRVLDDWLDQAADTLRALGEAADDLTGPIRRWAAPDALEGSGVRADLEPRVDAAVEVGAEVDR